MLRPPSVLQLAVDFHLGLSPFHHPLLPGSHPLLLPFLKHGITLPCQPTPSAPAFWHCDLETSLPLSVLKQYLHTLPFCPHLIGILLDSVPDASTSLLPCIPLVLFPTMALHASLGLAYVPTSCNSPISTTFK